VSIPLIDSPACEIEKSFTLELLSITTNIVASGSIMVGSTTATGTIKDGDIGNPLDDLYFGATGSTLVIPAPGVLSNDPCTAAGSVELVSNTRLGSLVLHTDGSFTYDSSDCYDDVDSFTIELPLKMVKYQILQR
jgi:hypothetical protein